MPRAPPRPPRTSLSIQTPLPLRGPAADSPGPRLTHLELHPGPTPSCPLRAPPFLLPSSSPWSSSPAGLPRGRSLPLGAPRWEAGWARGPPGPAFKRRGHYCRSRPTVPVSRRASLEPPQPRSPGSWSPSRPEPGPAPFNTPPLLWPAVRPALVVRFHRPQSRCRGRSQPRPPNPPARTVVQRYPPASLTTGCPAWAPRSGRGRRQWRVLEVSRPGARQPARGEGGPAGEAGWGRGALAQS